MRRNEKGAVSGAFFIVNQEQRLNWPAPAWQGTP
jgi:hypothetical protein